MPMSWLCVLLLCGVASVPLDDVDQALALDNACGDGASSEACSLSMLHLRSQESSDIRGGSDDNSAGRVCAAGTEMGCAGMGTWTGKECCLSGNYKCVAGTEMDCMGTGQWTGKVCCLTGNKNKCVRSTEMGCMGMGQWTGKLCCTQA